MKRFLIITLLVSGGLALLVHAVPDVVIIGFFMFLIPGVILGLSPAVFLWTLTFSALWFPLQHFLHKFLAAIIALPLTAGMAWYLPVQSRQASEADFNRAFVDQLTPDQPIKLQGDIRIHGALSGCDTFCVKLLLTDGVESVSSAKRQPLNQSMRVLEQDIRRTYRIVDKDRCEADHAPEMRDGLVNNSPELRKYLTLQYARGLCIKASTLVLEDHDFVIASETGEIFPDDYKANDSGRPDKWSFKSHPIEVKRFLIWDKTGQLLLRQSQFTTSKLRQPLLPLPGNGGIGWSRQRISNYGPYEEIDKTTLIEEHTNISFKVSKAQSINTFATEAIAILDSGNEVISNAEMGLMFAFLESFEGGEVEQQHVDLLKRYVAEPRIKSFSRISKAFAALGPETHELRKIVARRLNDGNWQEDYSGLRPLSSLWKYLPPKTLTALLPEEIELLQDYRKRPFATHLIARQSDRGVTAVPLLLEILEFHFNSHLGFRSNLDFQTDERILAAAQSALCKIGPPARSALSKLAKWQKDGRIAKRWRDRMSWKFTLARLGVPIENLVPPPDFRGSKADFHNQLKRRLNEYPVRGGC